jgi:hypothetical protein
MSAKKIVSLADRLENKRHKKQIEAYCGKVENIQKIVQCGSCQIRCAMCGLYLKNDDTSYDPHSASTGLTLCGSCRSEFDDFLSVSRGGQRSEIFWHNDEWVKMWSAWVNYRKAMTAFVESRELKMLMEELKTRS